MSTIEIKYRFSGAVLFKFEATAEQQESGLALRHALEAATAAKAYLRGAYLSGANLSGADLRGAYLSDADLSGANLRDADLSGANLRGAYLSGANLSGANLRGANLSDADLRGAYLRGAYLSGANLSGANLRGANLSDADLRGAYLRGAYLSGAAPATPEQSIENLDRVRAIILDNKARLEMGHWHQSEEWRARTCAEETLCETTHCLAGWLHVCSTDEAVRKMTDPQLAGIVSAPIAAKMFFRDEGTVLDWLDSRKYVAEIAEREQRAAERAAKKAAEAAS